MIFIRDDVMRLLQFLQYGNVLYLKLRRMLSKKGQGNGLIIFTNHGIGNFVILMPCIRTLVKKYKVTIFNTNPIISDIIFNHFPGVDIVSELPLSEKYQYAIFPICGVKKEYIYNTLTIPSVLGHTYIRNKWNIFFDVGINVNLNKIDGELNACNRIVEYFNAQPEKMFFLCIKPAMDIVPKRYIVLQTISEHSSKKNFNYSALIEEESKTKKILLVGSSNEKKSNEKYVVNSNIINLCGKMTLYETAELMKNSIHVYCNEGGISHIACAVGADVTVFYNKMITEKRVMHENVTYIPF